MDTIKKRIIDIDYIKGITISLVLLGHVVQNTSGSDFIENPVWIFIYSFHLPLFALLSGMFFSHSVKNTPINFLKKKTLGLLVPGFMWTRIIAIFSTIIFFVRNGIDFEKVKSYWTPSIGAYSFWFLMDIFICYVYTYLIFKMTHNNYLRAIGAVVLFLMPTYGYTRFLFPFFLLGVIVQRYSSWMSKHRISILSISIIGFLVTYIFWTGKDTIYFSPPKYINYQLGRIDWVYIRVGIERMFIGTFGSLAIIEFIRLIYNKYGKLYAQTSIVALGQNTLSLYIIQHITLESVIPNFNLDMNVLYSFVVSIIITIIELYLCMFIIRILDKNKWTRILLLGKR